jgi:hypothetical protein
VAADAVRSPVTVPSNAEAPDRSEHVLTDGPGRVDRSLPAGRREILLDGAGNGHRPGRQTRVTADRPGDRHVATGTEHITRHGAGDLDRATHGDEVSVDRAFDSDRSCEHIQIARDGFTRGDRDGLAAAKLVVRLCERDTDQNDERDDREGRRGRDTTRWAWHGRPS